MCVCMWGALGSVNAAGGVSVHSASLGYLTSVLLSLHLICRKEAGFICFQSGPGYHNGSRTTFYRFKCLCIKSTTNHFNVVIPDVTQAQSLSKSCLSSLLPLIPAIIHPLLLLHHFSKPSLHHLSPPGLGTYSFPLQMTLSSSQVSFIPNRTPCSCPHLLLI